MIDNVNEFSSISQRVLFAFEFAFSDFSPVSSETVSKESQRSLHALMKDIQAKLYNDPGLLGLPTDADKAYPWYLCNNQIPELNAVYMKVYKTLFDFYRFLYAASVNGELSGGTICISKTVLKAQKSAYKPVYGKALAAVGLEITESTDRVSLSYTKNPNVLAALKLFEGESKREVDSSVPEEWRSNANLFLNMFLFASCCFDGNTDYILKRIDELYNMNGLLIDLKESCEKKGYTCRTRFNFSQTDFSISIEMKKGIGGFSIVYSSRKKEKVGFGTLNGIGEKAILQDFENLDSEMKEHFINICRPCNGCLGCTKGGKNKAFTMNVSYEGKDFKLCPMFPNHTWVILDQALINRLMKYHDLQEKYAK